MRRIAFQWASGQESINEGLEPLKAGEIAAPVFGGLTGEARS